MKEHQKFFSVKNPKTGRIEGFVTVANIETPDAGATILKGNQKVLAARLSDARFFWENDLRVAKAGMGEWAEGLRAVTFHNKLGSRPSGSTASPHWRARLRPWWGRTQRTQRRPRGLPSWTCGPAWWANSPNCRA